MNYIDIPPVISFILTLLLDFNSFHLFLIKVLCSTYFEHLWFCVLLVTLVWMLHQTVCKDMHSNYCPEFVLLSSI